MCFPADMPPDPEPDDGRWTGRSRRPPRDWFACDICGSRDGVRIIEQRVKWGKAARWASHTQGYTGRPIPWCAACRKDRRSHSFRYHKRWD